MTVTRRQFLRGAGLAVAGAGLAAASVALGSGLGAAGEDLFKGVEPVGPVPTPRPAVVIIPPTAVPLQEVTRDYLDVIAFLDASTTYPGPLMARAQVELADFGDALVRPGNPGFRFTIFRLSGDEVYVPDAPLLRIESPPVPLPPAPPTIKPAPTPGATPTAAGPYTGPETNAASAAVYAEFVERRDAWEEQARASLDQYEQARLRHLASLAEIRQVVKTKTDQLRALVLKPGRAIDVEAALATSQDIFGERRQGRMRVLLVTDLQSTQAAGHRPNLSLMGLKVVVAFYHSNSAAEGDALVRRWKGRVEGAGASFVVTHPELGYSELLR